MIRLPISARCDLHWRAILAYSLLAFASCRMAHAAHEIDSIRLLDFQSQPHSLAEFDREFVVVVFLGLDCPLCKLYSERLNQLASDYASRCQFVGVVANRSEDLNEIDAFAQQYQYTFPVLKDPLAHLADTIGANFNPEVFVLDRNRKIHYRGRIDDQYVPGLSRKSAEQEELRIALQQLLAGEQVTQPETKPIGCLIQRPVVAAESGELTYFADIQPIIHQRCNSCHHPRGKAPFELTSYDDVVTWSETIELVLDERRMPPWFADPAHGDFTNDAAITESERARLLRWIDDGVPQGNLEDARELPELATEWSIPTPNLIVGMPQPFTVPATGVVDYQYILIDFSFEKDLWVQAAEIKPGNPQVVHHCVVFLVPPTGVDSATVDIGSLCFVVDSIPELNLPTGRAKRLPAGWRMLFVMHYTPIGSVQTDQTQLGLRVVAADSVKQEVATQVMYASDFSIPPHESNFRLEKTHTFRHDVELLSLFPHMHYRGKSFYYEATYPDGHTETLLNLKKWDFNWQHNYQFRQPKRLPAGTVLKAVGCYDNSKANPANPDPDSWVQQGDQSTDEMFNAYFDCVVADQDLQAQDLTGRIAEFWNSKIRLSTLSSLLLPIALTLLLGHRFSRKPPSSSE